MGKGVTMVGVIIQVVMVVTIQVEVAHHIEEAIIAIVQVMTDMEFIQLVEDVETKSSHIK